MAFLVPFVGACGDDAGRSGSTISTNTSGLCPSPIDAAVDAVVEAFECVPSAQTSRAIAEFMEPEWSLVETKHHCQADGEHTFSEAQYVHEDGRVQTNHHLSDGSLVERVAARALFEQRHREQWGTLPVYVAQRLRVYPLEEKMLFTVRAQRPEMRADGLRDVLLSLPSLRPGLLSHLDADNGGFKVRMPWPYALEHLASNPELFLVPQTLCRCVGDTGEMPPVGTEPVCEHTGLDDVHFEYQP